MSQASDWSDANVPAPDKVGIKDGKTYFFYQIPTSLTGGQVGYLSYQAPEAYNFNVDVDAGSIDGLLDNSFFAGDHLEIEVGVNPMQSYVERIKSVARVRPWLLKKETTGPNAGKYALLSLFVQQLFEPNKPISQEEYLAASDIYAGMNDRQRDYFSAVGLGEDSAAWKNLAQEATITVASLMESRGFTDVPKSVQEFVYTKYLSGEWNKDFLGENLDYLKSPNTSTVFDKEFADLIEGEAIGVNNINSQTTKKYLQSYLGGNIANKYSQEEIQKMSDILNLPNGNQLLAGTLQGEWDKLFPNRAGSNWDASYTLVNEIAKPWVGDLNEINDYGFIVDLMNTDDSNEQGKKARMWGLSNNNQTTANLLATQAQRSFGSSYRTVDT
tara:strand:- start:2249 stop:3403 length:1155 start_codon:yes stop_codon:yes gene_type:complete